MRDLFDKEFQKEMEDFFDNIDYEVQGKEKPEPLILTREEAEELDKDKILVHTDTDEEAEYWEMKAEIHNGI